MDLPCHYVSKLLAVFYTECTVIQGRQQPKKPSLTCNDVETGAAHQGYFKSSNRPSNFSMCFAKLPSSHQYTCYLAGFVLGRTKLVMRIRWPQSRKLTIPAFLTDFSFRRSPCRSLLKPSELAYTNLYEGMTLCSFLRVRRQRTMPT